MRKLSVIVKRPGSKPYHTYISDSLENLQNFVGGYIETLTFFEDMAVICNEEGRLRDLPYNCEVLGVEFVGDIIFVGINGDEFDDIPIDFKTFKILFQDLFEEVVHA